MANKWLQVLTSSAMEFHFDGATAGGPIKFFDTPLPMLVEYIVTNFGDNDLEMIPDLGVPETVQPRHCRRYVGKQLIIDAFLLGQSTECTLTARFLRQH